MTSTRASTINMRVRPAQKERLQEAAELANTNLSDFVLAAAEEKADMVIAEQATTWVPQAFFNTLYASLDEAQPNEALAAAAAQPPPLMPR